MASQVHSWRIFGRFRRRTCGRDDDSCHRVRQGMRIAFGMNQRWAEIDVDTPANTPEALRVFERQGAVIEEGDLNLGVDGPPLRTAIVKALLSGGLRRGFEAARPLQRPAHQLQPVLLRDCRDSSWQRRSQASRKHDQCALQTDSGCFFPEWVQRCADADTGYQRVAADFNPNPTWAGSSQLVGIS